MKILIEIGGGCLINVVSTHEVELYIVDHDNLKGATPEEMDFELENAKSPKRPDVVTHEHLTTEVFLDFLNTTLNPYEEER